MRIGGAPHVAAPQRVKLGEVYEDKVTGFVGTATSRHEYLNGCVRYNLEARVKSPGDKVVMEAFDEEQLVEFETKKAPERTSRSGGGEDRPQAAQR